ncbi:hypothetical protein D1007_24799 [Hordeum vulgare]|nr:hypothetical protein D1007_24799 [Hordeum vulgare]
MASVIPDIVGGDGGNDGGSDGVRFQEVVNCWGAAATRRRMARSSLRHRWSSHRRRLDALCLGNENYMNTQESCIVKDSEVQIKINDRKAQLERSGIQRDSDLNHFEGDTGVSEFCSDNSVHSDGSADEVVHMEIDSASEEDRPLELTALVKYVKNPGPTSRCHNDVEHKEKPDWFPEPDEFCFAGDLGIGDEEEEDEVDLPYLLKKGKSNKKNMKDRGLLKAINEVFPDSPQRYCLRHIYANFQCAGFRAAELKMLVDKASYSFTKHGHELGMTLLKVECEGAWKWLEKIPKETWCRYAMDYNCKTDLVVNNLSEVFNKMILDVRAKQFRTMFEGIRTKQMIKRQKTREKTEYSRWMITPNYSEKLEENKKYAKYCEAHKAGPDIWQVSSGEKQYCVNLATKSCDCRRWDMQSCNSSNEQG